MEVSEMKLIGKDTRFEINIPGSSTKAGAYFNEVTFNEDADVIDVSTALSSPGQQRVDEASAKATITCNGFIESQYNGVPGGVAGAPTSDINFIDLAIVGAVVAVKMTKLGASDDTIPSGSQATIYKLARYAPWQISKCSLKHGKRAPSEDTMEIIGTGGAVPVNYSPDWYTY
jgi:hypothetical protein